MLSVHGQHSTLNEKTSWLTNWIGHYLFTGCIVGVPANVAHLGVVASWTAGRILIGALGMFLQFAVFVTTFVTVFWAQETSITFLVTFHSQITTERLLWFGETTTRLGHQNLKNSRMVSEVSKKIITWKNVFHYLWHFTLLLSQSSNSVKST